jgi:iron-sulfur cluster repair protein YtfE (RIC family)
MKITDALYGEHGTLYALFAHCERSASAWELADLLLAGRVLDSVLLSHAELENGLLFDALDARMPGDGPVTAMRAEHDEIDGYLAALREAEDEATARHLLVTAVSTAREHFAKEEQILFPLAEELLGAEILLGLGREWSLRRGVAVSSNAA